MTTADRRGGNAFGDLCQTLPQVKLAQLHTPTNYGDFYEVDLAWYSSHRSPKRRLNIRRARGNEFGERVTAPFPPALWVFVNELSPGFHLVSPFWRGSPFFGVYTFKYFSVANVSSDTEIASILDECFRRGGFDQEAMSRWERQIREAIEQSEIPIGPSWGR
jgi:hypothetical protein